MNSLSKTIEEQKERKIVQILGFRKGKTYTEGYKIINNVIEGK